MDFVYYSITISIIILLLYYINTIKIDTFNTINNINNIDSTDIKNQILLEETKEIELDKELDFKNKTNLVSKMKDNNKSNKNIEVLDISSDIDKYKVNGDTNIDYFIHSLGMPSNFEKAYLCSNNNSLKDSLNYYDIVNNSAPTNYNKVHHRVSKDDLIIMNNNE